LETKRSRCIAGLLLLACTAAASADTFTFSTDHMSSILAKGKEHTLLSGNAVVTSGDTVINADQIELYFQYADCTGNVTVTDKSKGITLKSQNLFYDRDSDLSRVEGYAEMQDTKNQIVVKGGFLENRGKEEITIIEIGVRILKISENKEMACRSEFARYDRNADSLELSGMPVVFWKGDEYRAERITVNLKTDEINLEGGVSGTVKSENNQEQGTGSGSETTSGTSSGTGTSATTGDLGGTRGQ